MDTPQSFERILVGSCMHSHDIATKTTQALRALDFTCPTSRQIWHTIDDLIANDSEVTLDSVIARKGNLNPKELTDIYFMGSEFTPFQEHIDHIKEASTKRSIQRIAATALERAGLYNSKATEIITETESKLFALSQSTSKKVLTPIGDVLNAPESLSAQVAERIRKYTGGEQTFEGFKSGYLDLDDLIGGFSPGHLTIIGARPAVGKTSLLLNFAENICFKQNVPTLFFTLEMPSKELCEKLLCQTANINLNAFKSGCLTKNHLETIVKFGAEWAVRSMVVDEQAPILLDQVKARIACAKRIYGARIVFIDYLQLIRCPRQESRQLEIGEISRSLKEFAKEFKVAIVSAAQLNRESDKRENKKPLISDLRESGQIEQDADEILLLHRPDLYDRADAPGQLQIQVAKNRFGATGTVKLLFEKEKGRIENLVRF